ncbi:MAG: type II toxin-antitoxin system VapC family toxin [Gammaproteobacteria bacterium]|nr:type II toxin-antitoxin system VapC family toxin [Gammaproteobacteria bacterium]
MSIKYLLDTNVVSEPIKPSPAAGIMHQLKEHKDEMAIPVLVWHELRFGCSRLPRSRRRSMLEDYLEEVVLRNFPVLEYGPDAADWHAVERARLEGIGLTPPIIDGQIAAIAHVNKLILVTSNTADFQSFQGVILQNWL